jgi:ABC-type transporter Mla subunit MlaD
LTDAKRRLASAVRPARVVFRKEIGAAVTEAVGPAQAGVQAELREVRRILEDDMDAANEATAVFGRLLSQLGDRLDGIEELLQSIAARLDALEKPARQAPRRAKPATGPGGSGSGSGGSGSGARDAPGGGPAHPAG